MLYNVLINAQQFNLIFNYLNVFNFNIKRKKIKIKNHFKLFVFRDEQGELQSPVIIHRAMLGSIERMLAILTESFGGKWYELILT
jgi:hypothetical protein